MHTIPVWDINNNCWLRFTINGENNSVTAVERAMPEKKGSKFAGSWEPLLSSEWPTSSVVYDERRRRVEYRLVSNTGLSQLQRHEQISSSPLHVRIETFTSTDDWQQEDKNQQSDALLDEKVPAVKMSSEEKIGLPSRYPIFRDDLIQAHQVFDKKSAVSPLLELSASALHTSVEASFQPQNPFDVNAVEPSRLYSLLRVLSSDAQRTFVIGYLRQPSLYQYLLKDLNIDSYKLYGILLGLRDSELRSKFLNQFWEDKEFLYNIPGQKLWPILECLPDDYLGACCQKVIDGFHKRNLLPLSLISVYGNLSKQQKNFSIGQYSFLGRLLHNHVHLEKLLNILPAEDQFKFISHMDDATSRFVCALLLNAEPRREVLLTIIASCKDPKVVEKLSERLGLTLSKILFPKGEKIKATLAYLKAWQQPADVKGDPEEIHQNLVRAALIAYKTKRNEEKNYTSIFACISRFFGGYNRKQKTAAVDVLLRAIDAKSSLINNTMFDKHGAMKQGKLGKIYEEACRQFDEAKASSKSTKK